MIRKYQAKDSEDILAVWESASALAHPFLSREFLDLERHNIATVYLPNADTWVWESEGDVIGFISLNRSEVGGLFVDSNHHRSGIGQALMDVAHTLRGELEVEVFTANVIGRAFYAKYGFELIQHKVEEQTGFEIMRLRLTANKQSSQCG